MTTPAPILPETVRRLAQSEVDAILQELKGVTAVVIGTADGFDLASARRSTVSPARIAAMASSISAIAGVVSQEAELGQQNSVIINTDAGFAVVQGVRRTDAELVVNVIANKEAILGQVLYRAAQCARTLSSA